MTTFNGMLRTQNSINTVAQKALELTETLKACVFNRGSAPTGSASEYDNWQQQIECAQLSWHDGYDFGDD
jgi:hypothetical protein